MHLVSHTYTNVECDASYSQIIFDFLSILPFYVVRNILIIHHADGIIIA